MTYPLSQKTKASVLSDSHNRTRIEYDKVRLLMDDSAAGDTARRRYTVLQESLAESVPRWALFRDHAGMQAYSVNEWANPGDWVANHQALMDEADTLRRWVDASIPVSSTGAAELITVDEFGQVTDIMFSTADTALFRTLAQAFLDTCDGPAARGGGRR